MSTLLIVSLIGSIMILVITGLRALLQNRLHRSVFLILWLLAAVRLFIPTVLPSTASVYNFFIPDDKGYVVVSIEPAEVTDSVAQLQEADAVRDSGEVRGYDEAPEFDKEYLMSNGGTDTPVFVAPSYGESITEMVDEPLSGESVGKVLFILWLTGFGVFFTYFTWIHIRGRLRYRFALPEEAPAYLGKIRVKRLDTISSPMVYGFFRPVILLPLDFPEKDSPEYEQVLLHELTHVRSGDLWFKLGMLLVTCIHWFNPFVWMMLHLSTQDLEIRCDARVIRKLGKKRDYAMTLVQAEVKRTHHFAEAAFAFSLTELRLIAIAKAKVYLPRSILLCTILAVILVCCFATGPQAKVIERDPVQIIVAESETGPTAVTEQQLPSQPVLPMESMQISETTVLTETEPLSETKPITEATTETEPEATTEETASADGVSTGEETGSAPVQDFEKLSKMVELSMKEGTTKTISLPLPENANIYTAPSGKDLLSVNRAYDADDRLLYLTVRAWDEGDAVIYADVDGKRCMTVKVHVSFDPYYSVPDGWAYEEYGTSNTVYVTEGSWATFRLELPARTYYYQETYGGFLRYGENEAFSIRSWYDYDEGNYCVSVKCNEICDGDIYFYIDGVYWYKLHVRISQPSNGNRPDFWNYYGTGYSSGSNGMSDYEYLSQMGPQPVMPAYGVNSGYNHEPIIVWAPVVTGNGRVIEPGIYWPP